MDLISLAHFVSQFPGVSLAGASETDELCDFFEQKAMDGSSLKLTYIRRPDFFAHLKAHSSKFFVFVLRDKLNKIIGAGSLTLRYSMVQNELIEVGYLGDLRVTQPRLSARIWRDFYLKLLNSMPSIEELKNCRYLYTCILEDNQLAQKALETKSPLGYHLFERYQMVNVFFKKPLHSLKSQFEVRTNVSEAELFDFLSRTKRPLNYVFSGEHNEWEYRKKVWRDFEKYPSLAIFENQQLIAFTKLWSPSHQKKMRLDRLPKMLNFFLRVAASIFHLPTQGEYFHVLYMTLLTFDNNLPDNKRQEAMGLLLDRALNISKAGGFHALSFSEFESFPLNQALSAYFTHKTPLKLYFVDPNRNPVLDFKDHKAPSAFEMSLV